MTPERLTGKRTALYARYSSAMQREASIEDQLYRCREMVERLGGAVNDDLVFADVAVSGASLKRPQFERMMGMVDAGTIDAIVVEDISRLSRDLADASNLFRQLKYLGVPIIGVADGVDTGAKHGKLTYTIKSLVSDIYLDDLRDKTLRGLEGRARAGYSTGGLPYGYRSRADEDEFGREKGRLVEPHPERAQVVKRIFEMYRDGYSFAAIAGALNDDDIPPPRAYTKHKHRGWVKHTVRAMLMNRSYIGEWSFKKKEWRKVPGSNLRRYRDRPEEEVIRATYEERRIIDQALWDEVQARIEAVAARYKKNSRRGQGGKRTKYLLSGVLVCAECGAPMVITAGTSARYYVCGDAKNRKTCSNRLNVREDLARERILGELERRFTSPEAISFLRKAIVEHLKELGRTGSAELQERQARLGRTQKRIEALVAFIADGNASESVAATLRDLEHQASQEKAAIEALKATTKRPVVLPAPDAILQRGVRLKEILAGDPMRAQLALRRLLRGGTIKMTPQPDRTYVAEGEYWPLIAIDDAATKAQRPETGEASGRGRPFRSAGRI